MKFPLVIICLLVSNFLFAQNFEILYEVSFQSKKNSKTVTKELFELDIDTKVKESIFYSHSKKISDSIYQQINNPRNKKTAEELISIAPNYSFQFLVLKNANRSKVEIYEKFSEQVFKLNEDFGLNWKLIKEKKIIQNFKCDKAITELGGRIWEVWFARDIPINDGPYKFHGLPGLILEVRSLDNEYSFLLKSLKKTVGAFGKPKFDVEVKNKEKLLELKKSFSENPSNQDRQLDSEISANKMIVNGKELSLEESYKLLNEELWNWMKEHNNPFEKNDIWVR